MSTPIRFRRVRALLLALPLVLACEADSVKPEFVNQVELYWELALNHRAVMLSTAAPYDTLTLVATPRNFRGEPIAEVGVPTYTSADVERVRVTSEGVLVAVAVTSTPVWVRARLNVGGLTHTDSARIAVVATNPPPVLASLEADPLPPDSAKTAASISFEVPTKTVFLPSRAVDISGTSIAGLPIYFGSSDTATAKIDRVTGQLKAIRPGTVNLIASTTAFGITKADTVPYRIGWPLAYSIWLTTQTHAGGGVPIPVFFPTQVTLAVGATVKWGASSGGVPFPTGITEWDINFVAADLPNVAAGSASSLYNSGFMAFECTVDFPPFIYRGNCEAGNILMGGSTPYVPFANAYRVFTAPGTYEYHSTTLGLTGRIVVIEDE